VIWKAPTENGFSSFTTGAGKVYTLMGKKIENTPTEVCVAMNAADGKPVWEQPVDVVAMYDKGGDAGTPDNKGGDGPRSTPSFSDGMVYAYGSNMTLTAYDAASGKPAWSHNIKKEFGGREIRWANASSPVIDGDLVFVSGGGAGQSLIAFNKKTGSVVWKNHDELMTHATPTLATILGVKQLIFFQQSGLHAVDPATGATLWKQPYSYKISTAISPVVSGDIVYCSAGYGVGGGAYKISKEGAAFKSTELWRTPGDAQVANHWSTPVCKDGYLYGMFSFKAYGAGPMKCVEVATGKVLWEKPGFGAGNVILVGDKVLALGDDGSLVTVEASPKAYTEVARAKVIDGKCWSTPILANGKVYVRSTKMGACLDVK
jgi:outer membrane protein assembly factor BamB